MEFQYQSHHGPGFIEPCIPSKAARAPMGPEWVFEIKHDGYRLMVRKDDERVRERRLKVRSVLLVARASCMTTKACRALRCSTHATTMPKYP
jgi:ATP-dependent DNA ligase